MKTSTSPAVSLPQASSRKVDSEMLEIRQLVDLIGYSFFVALGCGFTMGVYLAALNQYIRVRSLHRSVITNLVAATSFLFPIALQRDVTEVDNLKWGVWVAMWFLMVVFTMTADLTNWWVCTQAARKRLGR